ncbi:hypothetical protein [Azonexus sp. IMCC34839]|uniref:hypothetical protein n=1 Tax=Azonexus sp. IMCC34839 TaxID=3133695 RepID=UPI00399BA9EA
MRITSRFNPPTPNDDPLTFNNKAFATIGALNTWSGEANSLADEVNDRASAASDRADQASASASTATTKANEAKNSATEAASSATAAAASASTSATKANEAAQSAFSAAANANAAGVSKNGAAASATAAAASAATATTKATEAATSAELARQRSTDGHFEGGVHVHSGTIGYAERSGGEAVQSGSQSFVSINKPTGKITTSLIDLVPGGIYQFVVLNEFVTRNDVVVHSLEDWMSSYFNSWITVRDGQFTVVIKNISESNVSEVLKINFAVIKCSLI